MKTLASFVFVVVAVLAFAFAREWRKDLLEETGRETLELQTRLQEIESRFEGYWPRYERLEEALSGASNLCLRLTAELADERTVNEPLRSQIEALSEARIAQQARKSELQKAYADAQTATKELELRLQEAIQANADAEKREQTLQEQVTKGETRARTLEETLRTRDADLAGVRQNLERQAAESDSLREANAVLPGLQAELEKVKADLRAASTERDQVRTERDRLQEALGTRTTERDQALAERDAALAARATLEKELRSLRSKPPTEEE